MTAVLHRTLECMYVSYFLAFAIEFFGGLHSRQCGQFDLFFFNWRFNMYRLLLQKLVMAYTVKVIQ